MEKIIYKTKVVVKMTPEQFFHLSGILLFATVANGKNRFLNAKERRFFTTFANIKTIDRRKSTINDKK